MDFRTPEKMRSVARAIPAEALGVPRRALEGEMARSIAVPVLRREDASGAAAIPAALRRKVALRPKSCPPMKVSEFGVSAAASSAGSLRDAAIPRLPALYPLESSHFRSAASPMALHSAVRGALAELHADVSFSSAAAKYTAELYARYTPLRFVVRFFRVESDVTVVELQKRSGCCFAWAEVCDSLLLALSSLRMKPMPPLPVRPSRDVLPSLVGLHRPLPSRPLFKPAAGGGCGSAGDGAVGDDDDGVGSAAVDGAAVDCAAVDCAAVDCAAVDCAAAEEEDALQPLLRMAAAPFEDSAAPALAELSTVTASVDGAAASLLRVAADGDELACSFLAALPSRLAVERSKRVRLAATALLANLLSAAGGKPSPVLVSCAAAALPALLAALDGSDGVALRYESARALACGASCGQPLHHALQQRTTAATLRMRCTEACSDARVKPLLRKAVRLLMH